MMEKLLEQLPTAFLVLLVLGLFHVAKFLFKDKWDSVKQEESRRDYLIQQNTIALTALNVELKNLKELFLSIHAKQTKMEGDINALHRAKREVSPKG